MSLIPIWVRFPQLPIDLFDNEFLNYFSNLLGRTIKVDGTTLKWARGKFARVCVEIDITKPLVSKYKLDGLTYFLEYESLHFIFFECGTYSHLTKKWPNNKEAKENSQK